jgi:hypothetical protein
MNGFAGDGIHCAVAPGYKAMVIGGRVQVVPMVKGDKHDNELAAINAVLNKMAREEPRRIANVFGGSPHTIGLGPGANGGSEAAASAISAAAASRESPNPSDARDHLEYVRRQVATLEQKTAALAAASKQGLDELRKFREQSAAENQRMIKALEKKADSLLDKVVDQTQAILTHTPHREGAHIPSMDFDGDQKKASRSNNGADVQ